VILFLPLIYLIQTSKSNPYLFSGHWSLEYLQREFIGDLPKSAIDIQYQPLGNYALLTFRSSPLEAFEFAKRFCYGVLLEGYDPFNSVDNHDANNGYLIQTSPGYFYYSHPINNLNTQSGNRCNDIKRGGLHQIAVYTKDSRLYEVKLEISAACTNQNAPHPCDGIAVFHRIQGSIELGKSYTIRSRYAEGDSWQIIVEPDKEYKLMLSLKDAQQTQNFGGVQVSIIPVLISGNEPYCEACWVNTYNTSDEASEISFFSPSSGQLNINLLWMNADKTYEMSVVQNS
jgi:hypothetical protein